MDDPTRQLLPESKPTDSQLESQDQKDYGTVNAPSQEENGATFREPPLPAGHLQAPEEPAITEGRRSVKRAFPILAIGGCVVSLCNVLQSHRLMSISRSF